ncbi:hypothetical protein [Brevibacillus dissolubilis]|uniref:hypothetical protein n=1 Tax=Brevibacillus dissolubilis TaxID=1844116 RepID=UPI001116DD39|nr:hypothetical protein [Brevibacillus dissolubilis]
MMEWTWVESGESLVGHLEGEVDGEFSRGGDDKVGEKEEMLEEIMGKERVAGSRVAGSRRRKKGLRQVIRRRIRYA